MSKNIEQLLIRTALADERVGLEELQRRASLANEHDRPHLEAHPDAVHLPPAQIANGQVFVAELDGRVAGFAAVVGGELDGLFVEPDLWRRGIGAMLVNEAVHQARLRGLALTVTANPHALEFYEKCGFSLEGETQTRFGPALRMSR